MDGHYWKLVVANYDEETSGECTLSIQYAIPTKWEPYPSRKPCSGDGSLPSEDCGRAPALRL